MKFRFIAFFFQKMDKSDLKNVLKIIQYFASAPRNKGVNPIFPIPYFAFAPRNKGVNAIFPIPHFASAPCSLVLLA